MGPKLEKFLLKANRLSRMYSIARICLLLFATIMAIVMSIIYDRSSVSFQWTVWIGDHSVLSIAGQLCFYVAMFIASNVVMAEKRNIIASLEGSEELKGLKNVLRRNIT